MNLAVVYNAESGGEYTQTRLAAMFEQHGHAVDSWLPVRKDLERNLDSYIKGNPKATVAVVGGDGTMTAVAKVLGGTQATLAPLPGGTLNHFAGDLGVPSDMDAAMARLKGLKPRQIDYGSINDVVFCNNAGLGIYPSSLVEREAHESRLSKWPAAIWGAVKAMAVFRHYRLTIDGRRVKTPFVFIGNNRYSLEGGKIERRHLDEGVLCVYVAQAHHRWQLALALAAALLGKTYRLHYFEAESFTIEARRSSMKVSHDGELDKLATPLEVHLHKAKLHVRA